MDEITILKQIAEGDPDDKKCMVKLLDHFKHSGPNGQHVCMVFEYLGDNLLTLIKYSDYRGVPLHKVKEICYHVLVGLDYLHRHLSIIYTDLKLENILLMSMIDLLKDPTKSRAPLILPGGKDNDASESGYAKALNGDISRNQKKNIRRKAKCVAQKCVDRDEADADVETSTEVEASPNTRLNVRSVEDQSTSSVNGSKRGNCTTRQKLLASIDLKCKLVDSGNACFYPL
ncbi:SRSF protein kinase 2-like [Pyrus ussuriensis x Pyrus communis]|uniref:non-specific serine/threonine protein kinase n=1 Tax=Pyrus ussuriensis x Pyrus communis TaxID=2448454 RepID=A0A5N5GTV3_9ROSA|nr:SRSF protein kinase 2-like [Pyrus ussuriensis x Pyrus communis]